VSNHKSPSGLCLNPRDLFTRSSFNELEADHSIPAGLSLRLNLSWALVGNIGYALTQWGLLVLLTKLFDPTQFGKYALALSIVTPIFSTSTLQLRAIQVSAVEEKAHFADYVVLRVFTNSLALTCLLVLVVFRLFEAQVVYLILLLALNQAVMLVKDIYQGSMQRHERMDYVSISNVLQGVASVGVAAALAFCTGNLLLAVAGMLVARVAVFLSYDVSRSKALAGEAQTLLTRADLRKALSVSRLRPLVHKALPLGVMMLLLSFYPNIPRYFLAGYWGEAYVGYFAAIATLMSVQELMIVPLGEAALRKLSLYYATNKAAYTGLLCKLIAIGVVLGTIGVAVAMQLGSPLLTVLFRKEYGGFVESLVWLMLARLVLNVQCFMGYGITAAGRYRAQAWIWGMAITAMLLSSWLLIPTRSALGAAWALFICACIATAASIIVLAGAIRTSNVFDAAIIQDNT
jgi:O-antigen/teichoic acid export membrane protein